MSGLLAAIVRTSITALKNDVVTAVDKLFRNKITSDTLYAGITYALVLSGTAQPAATPSFNTLASNLLADVFRGLSQDQAFLSSLLATGTARASPLLTFFATLVQSSESLSHCDTDNNFPALCLGVTHHGSCPCNNYIYTKQLPNRPRGKTYWI